MPHAPRGVIRLQKRARREKIGSVTPVLSLGAGFIALRIHPGRLRHPARSLSLGSVVINCLARSTAPRRAAPSPSSSAAGTSPATTQASLFQNINHNPTNPSHSLQNLVAAGPVDTHVASQVLHYLSLISFVGVVLIPFTVAILFSRGPSHGRSACSRRRRTSRGHCAPPCTTPRRARTGRFREVGEAMDVPAQPLAVCTGRGQEWQEGAFDRLTTMYGTLDAFSTLDATGGANCVEATYPQNVLAGTPIRLPEGDSGFWIPILTNPDVVERNSENCVDSLNRKNLNSSGRIATFYPHAPVVPEAQEQTPRTIRNLAGRLLVREMRETFCFLVPALVGAEFAGTLVLPGAFSFTPYDSLASSVPNHCSAHPARPRARLPCVPSVIVSHQFAHVGLSPLKCGTYRGIFATLCFYPGLHDEVRPLGTGFLGTDDEELDTAVFDDVNPDNSVTDSFRRGSPEFESRTTSTGATHADRASFLRVCPLLLDLTVYGRSLRPTLSALPDEPPRAESLRLLRVLQQLNPYPLEAERSALLERNRNFLPPPFVDRQFAKLTHQFFFVGP
ncbi:hypothetical protein B0H11DRAFT_2248431 [Mycena galericulata]|nr:hypothetical protein B0H11DRAFT_2248431 [Mycena galericulata]